MRLVWMTVAAMLALLLPRFCGGVRRSNNSPASKLLPAGEYFEDIEVLYQLDELFRGISDWRLRSSLARALLLVVPLGMGATQTLNLQGCVLGNDDMLVLKEALGVSIERVPDSDGNGDTSGNRWAFKRISEIGSKSIELLLQDIVIGGVESSRHPSAEGEVTRKNLEAAVPSTGVDAFEEKMLIKQAYDDISSGKKSRSIMTRAQRIWELYQHDYQPFPKIKVRFFDGYRTGQRVGDECEVSLVSSVKEALELVHEAKACVSEGQKKIFCLRHGAALAPLDMSSTFLRSELRPPGVNLYILD